MPKKVTTSTTTNTTSSSSGLGGSTHYRFNAWVALMVLSFVALISIVAVTEDKDRDFQEKWCLSMAGISMCLGFCGCIGHLVYALREKFITSLVELIMAVLCVGCWIFGLPMITTPDDGLAVNHNFQIDNANLYFASWGSFIFALFLLASVANERGVSASRDGLARRWLWLLMSSLVVMAASARLFDAFCQGREFVDGEFCKELKLGISLGVISAVICGFMTLLMWTSPDAAPLTAVGAFFALVEMIIFGVLIAYLTFDDGPATFVGNLFFGVWASAILALDLGVCYTMVYVYY